MSNHKEYKEAVIKFGRTEGKEALEKLKKLSPETVAIFLAMREQTVGRSKIDPKTREFIAIATYVAMGDAYHHVKNHMYAGLKTALFTKEELIDMLVQMSFWIGIIRCEAALHTLIEVLEELKEGK